MIPDVLTDATGLRPGEMAAAVGAGGKTSLLEALARECHAAGWWPTILTTTTKIFAPELDESGLLLTGDAARLRELLVFLPGQAESPLTLARARAGESPVPGGGERRRMKLHGFAPEETEGFRTREGVVLVEADGARGLPLKAPGPAEPVIPPRADLILGVMGLDALGTPLDEVHVFRPDGVARITGQPLGSEVRPETLGRLAAHPEGLFRGTPEGARRILVLNKVDRFSSVASARRITYIIWELAQRGKSPPERLIGLDLSSSEARVALRLR